MPQGKRVRLPRGALARLSKAEPKLGRVVKQIGGFDMRMAMTSTHLEMLVRSIVYQQLSGKAAATIFGRFRDLFDEEAFPTADAVAKVHYTKLRKAGLSRAKQAAVRDLCRHVCSGRLDLDAIEDLDDEEAIERLSAVRGIGRWSAQMFLMFQLGRLDIWPDGDLGVRKGIMQLHGLREMPGKKQMDRIGELYRPYRSVAAWYMWRYVDGEGQI